MRARAVYRIGPETARLSHRALTTGDAAALFAINGNAEVMRHTGEPMLGSVEEARAAIEAYPDFDTVGFGRWACVLKATGAIIGLNGLKYLPELDAVDVGYRFLPPYWGQGLATEACAAGVAFGFRTLGLARIIGMVLPGNPASARVLEKCGFSRAGELVFRGDRVQRYVIEAPADTGPV